ncbi:putative ABC transporter ATP-binding protein [bioreactor metagenome]|uniref:Putative ABC transporter ATP-binding protein n=1 Tax=bioreactor metagenome TaxID=1076179 RepID=A0A645A125_9ZZZZ
MALAIDKLVAGIMLKFTGGSGEIDFDYIGTVLLGLLGLYVLSATFSYLQGFLMSGVSAKVSYKLRKDIMEKINKLPLAYFHKNSQGDVLSRITNDVDTLNTSLNQSLTQIITSITTLVGVFIMMLTISWPLTLVILGVLIVSMMLLMLIMSKSQKHFANQQKYLGAVNGHVEEMYGGHVVMKAFNGEVKSVAAFDKENDQLIEAGFKAEFLSGLMMPLLSLIGNLGYVVVCIMGGAMAAAGNMTIGDIQAFLQYVRNFTQPLTQVAQVGSQLQRMVAASERIFEFLEEEEETVTEAKIAMATADVKGNVRFEHVKFGYEPENLVIKDFSADIKEGQKVALVGPTGAGKTTMVKLLMRFYDLTDGAIYIDNHNLTDFTRSDLRTEFGMVLQDTWLYNGTIMENIRYGKLDATDEEVIAAAKAAQVDHFVRTLPDGYNMVLNEEANNVSQGEKQLLTIARAILADPQIMILDEATSSVDTRTEVLIQKAMDTLMQGRTSFIIAHRLSTIKNADLILCMNNGDIVEQGTHEELLAKGGFYADLYNSQFDEGE